MKKYFYYLILILSIFTYNTSCIYAQYCTTNLYNSSSGYNCEDGDLINDVTFNSISNLATGCPTGSGGYSNYTSMSTTLIPGSSYTLGVTTTYSSEMEWVKVWIDYNDDYSFDDATELIFASTSAISSSTPISQSITIPASATPGTHRMRVRIVYNTSSFTACSNHSYGEVEDYSVIIAPLTGPGIPTSFTATPSQGQIALSWALNPNNDNVMVLRNTTNSFGTPVSGISYTVGSTLGSATIIYKGNATTFTDSPLASQTQYYYQIYSYTSANVYSAAPASVSATTPCGIFNVPFIERFNTTTMPNCWSISGPQNWLFTNTWQDYGADLVTDHSGTGGSFAGVDGSGSVSITGITLTSPFINVTGVTNPELRFWLFNNNINDASYQTLRVSLYTGSSWIDTAYFWGPTMNNAAWQEIVIPLSSYTITGNIQFKFIVDKGPGSPFYDDLIIDDIQVQQGPDCLSPTSFSVSGITINSAILNWTPGSTETQWQVELGPYGFTPTGVPTKTVSSLPYTYSGLSPSTKYSYYVRAICPTTGYSFWVGPYSFTTLCVAVPTLPITQNFDGVTTPNLPDCWRKIVNSTNVSAVVQTSTSNAHSSPNSLQMSNSTDQTADLVLVSPQHTATPITTTRVRFWAYGSSGTTAVVVGVMSDPDNVNTFAPVQTVTLSTTNSLYAVNLSSYIGTGTYVAFKHANNATSQSIYLDDISWELIPTCIEPSVTLTVNNITSSGATLGWTENGTATSWQVAYHDTVFTPGGATGTIVMANVNPFPLNGLQANKKYYFYVRSYCSSTEQSVWVGPQTFTTLCNPVSLPYNEGFESITVANTLPSCMSSTNLGSLTYTYLTSTGSYNQAAKTGSKFASFRYGSNDWIYTAPLQLTGGQNYSFSMWYVTDSYSGWNTLEAKFGTSASSADMTGNIVSISGPTNTTYNQMVGTFAPSTTGVYYIGIHCVANTSPWYLSIDDINVDITTAPTAPQVFNAAPASSTQINLTWTPNVSNDQVILVTNTTNTFGTPVDGTSYSVGSTLPGGGTVLYKGSLASFNHTGLNNLTTYYYKLWSVSATNVYSLSGLSKSTTTSASLPLMETFNASTTIPTGWSTDFSILSTHGNNSSNGLYRNMYGSIPTAYVITPFVGVITATTELSFDYRIVNYSGYPSTATTLAANDSINILVSTDGVNFTKIDQINSTTHVTSNAFATKTYNLGAFAGGVAQVKLDCKWGTGDWYIDFDNINIIDMIPMVYTSSTTSTPTTAVVPLNTTNNQVLKITVETTGILNPITVSSFTFNTNGSTNPSTDIKTAKLWSTGAVNSFTNPVLLGDTIVSPNGPFSISTGTGMPYNLLSGVNYFWLTYDVPGTAVSGNVLDAELTSLVVGGTTYIPTQTAPSGSRMLKGPLAGIYTINNTQPTAGTNYNSFTDAFSELNLVGVNGPTTFNVIADQTHNFTITGASPNNYALYLTASGSQANPIVFQKSGSGSNPVISITGTSATNDKGIWLNGSDFVTFDRIDIQDAGTASASWLEYGYYITNSSGTNGAQYNNVKNSVIDLSKGNSSSIGIYVYASSVTSTDGVNKYNKFYNNTVQDAAKGYQFTGYSATYFDVGNEIGNETSGTSIIRNIGQVSNTFQAIAINTSYQDSLKIFNTLIDTVAGTTTTNPAACGMNLNYSKNNLIYGNTLRQINGVNGDAYMINYTNGYVGTSEIYNNYLTELRNSGTAGNANNMRLYGVTSAFTMNVYNNKIDSSLNTVGDVTGIYVGSTTGCTFNVYKNKLYNFKTTAAAKSILSIHADNAGFYNIYNNLVYDIKAPASTTTASTRGLDLGGGTCKVYYNTIYIDYTSTVAGNSSAAIYATNTPTIDMRNNIFINKSDVTTGTRAVAFWYTSTSYTNIATTTNNNIYYAGLPSLKTPIFYNGTNSDTTIAQYKVRMSTRDQQSNTEDVPFISNVSPYDLHISTSIATRTESNGQKITSPAITTDLDGNIRWGEASYTGSGVGTDIGAYEFNGITIDEFAPAISYTPLAIDTLLTNRAFNNVTITDGSGVNITTAKPRVYFKKTSNANTYVDNLNLTDGWKYAEASNTTSPFNFNLDYSLLYSGVNPTDTIQYFVIAQDMIGTPNVGANTATFTTAPTSVNLSAANFPASGSINFYRIALKVGGTYDVGAGNTFRNLTANADSGFFKFVNSNIVTGDIVVNITSDTIWENGAVALNQIIEGGTGNYTIKIQPASASPKLIFGTVANGMIRFDGADRVTIDGSSGGSGMYLRFRNTNTSNPTFTFINGATYNTITNSIIEGASTSSSNGVIFFSTSTGISGNNYNTISNDSIRNLLTGSVPANLIYSTSTTDKLNSYNTITNNHLLNYTAYGVYVTSTNGDAWNISNNYIYQTAARTTALRGITVATGANGKGHIINGNSIGGSNSLRQGSAFSTSSNVYAIELSTDTATAFASQIQGNIISNIGTTGSVAVFGLYLTSGSIDVGTVTPNILGGGATPADTIRNGLDNGIIYLSNSSGGTYNIQNNIVGNISYYKAGGDRTSGIYSSVSSGKVIIKNNIVRDIYHNGTGTAYTYLPVGIYINNSASEGTIIEGNSVYNINSTATGTSAYSVAGIVIAGNNSNTTIANNQIYDIKANGTGTGSSAPVVNGIYQGTASVTYYNNVINLGNGIPTAATVYGINNVSTVSSTNNYYYNTISINGTSTGTNKSFAFYRSASGTPTNAVNLKNNILSNTRTNSTAALNFAFGVNSLTAVTSDYNLLYTGNDTVAFNNNVKYTFADWKTTTTYDVNSVSGDPEFTSATDLTPLLTSIAVSAATPIVGYTKDIVDHNRNFLTPTIGAYEIEPTKTLNITVLLQGLYNPDSGAMAPVLDASGLPVYSSSIADKITVELRDAIDPTLTVATFSNKSLNTNGICKVQGIQSTLNSSYYIVIKTRNHIQTWSANPIPFGSAIVYYDFTTAASQAYGDNEYEAATGIYVIYGGDVNQDGLVDSGDMTPIDNLSTALTLGFYPEDVNGDGIIDSGDMTIVNNNSTAIIMVQMP